MGFVLQEVQNKRFILLVIGRASANKEVIAMRASSKAALIVSTGLIALFLAIFTEEFELIEEFIRQLSESSLAGTPKP